MAQVTMTGQEFRQMIKMEDEREELLNILVKAQQVTFPVGAITTYNAGVFAAIQYPDWVTDTLYKCMEAQLLLKDQGELERWFESGCHYFNCLTRTFNKYDWDGGVNMLDYSEKLRERYEEWYNDRPNTVVEVEEDEE